MEQLLMVVYVLLSAAIVGLILLQQGKGADMGASFGAGASQTVFGAAGTGNLLTRSTAVLATIFFIASIGLAVMAKHKAEAMRDGGIPVLPASESRDNAAPSAPEQDTVPGAASVPTAPTDEIPSAPAAAEEPSATPAAGAVGDGEVPAPPAG